MSIKKCGGQHSVTETTFKPVIVNGVNTYMTVESKEQVTVKCESEFQDELYGKDMRVCTPKGTDRCVCTVCGKEQALKGTTVVEKKGKK